jgi:agmatinase
MSNILTSAPEHGHKTFLFSELALDLDNLEADIAFLGIPFGHPYTIRNVTNDQSNAPTAVRQASDRVSRSLERYDFDIGGPLFDDRPIRMVDCGDVSGEMHDPAAHSRRAEEAMRKIIASGALPLIIGGDHAIPIPVLRAFDDKGPLVLVHVDAHIDWRDDVGGVSEGLSSPIRRASEMPHVTEIFQIGIRSQGSARRTDVDAALAYGARIVTAYEVHDGGMDAVLSNIPDNARYYITIDADGLDPSVMPAVEGPAPGGLTFDQTRRLIHGLVNKGQVVGMDIVEITPSRDINRISAITAGRLFLNLIGAAVRAGYFEK